MNFKQFSTLLSRKPSTAQAADLAAASVKEEKDKVYDHLVFLVHGIGEHEEKWKIIVPKVEKCHKKVQQYMGVPSRVKWIPIEWHSILHTQTDEHVVKVTPKGMAGPRSFINNTLIDILFWASPYGQTIITEVGQQLNQLYNQFKKDHPDFSGGVSVSIIICYDLLSNQAGAACLTDSSDNDKADKAEKTDKTELNRTMSPRGYNKGEGNVAAWQRLAPKPAISTAHQPGEPQLKYPLIEFEVENLFMLGSPTGIFLTARGVGYPVRLPKCNNLYNIYNPNDPVSYLIEPLVDPGFLNQTPSIVPHFPDPTDALKGAVARGSKSLFSYYKNTTTTTTTAGATSSTTTTTTVTKEVLPSVPTSPSSASASTVSSPTLLSVCQGEIGCPNESIDSSGATDVAEIIAELEEVAVAEALEETLGMELNDPSLSPRLERIEKTTITIEDKTNTVPQTPPTPTSGNGNGTNGAEKANQFFEGIRYDFKLQPSGIVENLSEYAALINAHRCYWDSKDVMLFVLQHL